MFEVIGESGAVYVGHVTMFKPRLVTVCTVNIGARADKVTNYIRIYFWWIHRDILEIHALLSLSIYPGKPLIPSNWVYRLEYLFAVVYSE